jgi:hypothetical protein
MHQLYRIVWCRTKARNPHAETITQSVVGWIRPSRDPAVSNPTLDLIELMRKSAGCDDRMHIV